METIDVDIAKIQEKRNNKEIASLTTSIYDVDLYGIGNKFEGYEEDQDAGEREVARKLASLTAPKSVLRDLPRGMGGNDDNLVFKKL
ncbi:hypothetical protein MRB53_013859 [Persea americana]|uniref:Uncharacterized protein n=1 Tax=Persea americana TaxID=3435 RepID=A0ACC2K9E9_PERAE|nr:hypothetical protein MRB53_013859 [Persea americana]